MERLKGQVALITGGGKGLGREIALALAKEGVHLILNYYSSEEEAKKTVKEIEGVGVQALALKADVSKIHEISGLVEKSLKRFGKIDILINNSGVFIRTPLEILTEENWNQTLDTNLRSVLFTSQAVSKPMLKQRGGKIINIADAGGIRPWSGYLAYCVSKAGVIMATKCLAKALAPEIQVNCLAPGMITIPLEWNEERKEAMREKIPMKVFGSYRDVVNASLFLLCDAPYMTGQTLIVDGGGSLN